MEAWTESEPTSVNGSRRRINRTDPGRVIRRGRDPTDQESAQTKGPAQSPVEETEGECEGSTAKEAPVEKSEANHRSRASAPDAMPPGGQPA